MRNKIVIPGGPSVKNHYLQDIEDITNFLTETDRK